MKTNKILTLFASAGISSIISIILYFIVFNESVELFGEESLIFPERRHGRIFYTALGIGLITILTILFFKWKKKNAIASGIALSLIISIIIVARIGPVYLNKSNYYQEFKREEWISADRKPVKMARKIVVDQTLIGKTWAEVNQTLGGSDREFGDSIFYQTDAWYCQLLLIMDNNRVRVARLIAD